MSLMVSISGIRGIIGESLTPEVAVRYARAFAEYSRRAGATPPVIVVGRDGRISGDMLCSLITGTLRAAGAAVIDLGICPTPTVQLAVEHEHAAGGISVTASHNPIQWNGMKFVAPTGMFLDAEENREFWSLAGGGTGYAHWNDLGSLRTDEGWIQRHIDLVLSLPYLDTDVVRRRRFRVVVDAVNAAGGRIVPPLLRALGCTVVEMHCDVSGVFSHTPEPIPENLTDLASRVRSEGADMGIAVDPDVDRLVLITERGEPYGEEYTIASAVKFVLDREARSRAGARHTVVVNLSTTRAVDDIARARGATVIRTPVGEINVARRMKAEGAVVGGEGSGGVILPELHLGRDAMVGIGLLLQQFAEYDGSVSAFKASLPAYSIAKGKVSVGVRAPDEILDAVRTAHAAEGRITTDDGTKIDYPDSWVHLRKSNTEPIIRVIAEAPTPGRAQTLVGDFTREIEQLL